jgi:hypothetical protein
VSLFDRVQEPLHEDSRRKAKKGFDATNPMNWDQMSRKLRKVHLGALKRAGVKPGRDSDASVDTALDKSAKVRDYVGGHMDREQMSKGSRRGKNASFGKKTKGSAFEKKQGAAGQDAQKKRAQAMYDRTKKVPKGFKLVFGKVARA